MRLFRTLPLMLAATSSIVGAQSPAAAPDSGKKPPRRVQVTPEMERTAFAGERARALLHRARAARIAQDSAIRAYDAKTWQRLTVGLGIKGYDRVLMRTENAARVRWARGSGVWIEPTGRRGAAPMFGESSVSMDMAAATPIPYFPGREQLWTPSSYAQLAQAEVSEDDLIHPLATGAEAYYRYEVGDSISFSLPDRRRIALRELRVISREPSWRTFVGSFWFDVDQGHLARAAYRLSREIDVWAMISEEERREVEEAIEENREVLEREDEPGFIARALMSPLRGNISAITVEYGLHEGRFWLPKLNVAEGFAQAGFLRMPIRLEERFTYDGVNVALDLPPIPQPEEVGLAAADTMLRGQLTVNAGTARPSMLDVDAARAREDSLVHRHLRRADSLDTTADSLHALGDTAKAAEHRARANTSRSLAGRVTGRRAACANGTTHVADIGSRYDGALRVGVRMPCDTTVLANSPDLPGSIFDDDAEVFGTAERDALLAALDFSLQPAWGPQPPVFHTGLNMFRYNRIEGPSLGASLTSALGRGYTAQAIARIGAADWVPNGELSLSRTNGRSALRFGVFHRLAVANDGWGEPLSFGASVANVLYARDEGYYYRTWGAEVGGTRDAPAMFGAASLDWRLFAEQQRSAGPDPNIQSSVGHLVGSSRFDQNVDAAQLTALGGAAALRRSFGLDPRGFRLTTRTHIEGAATHRSDSAGDAGYGRALLDLTATRGFGSVGVSLTGAAGTSVGEVPVQRLFYIGGLQTVRGQFARLAPGEGRIGNSFWLGRAEIGRGVGVRTAVFYDVGWAGDRNAFTSPGRPMSGAGFGLSVLDGLIRTDISRGIWPEQRWRVDVQLGARF